MRLNIYLNRVSNLFAENRLLKFIVVVLSGALIVSQFLVVQRARDQKVILVPPGLKEQAEIGHDTLSDSYVRAFTRYVMALALSYTHTTARTQFDELLLLYAPESFAKAKQTFYTLANHIETAEVSGVFHIQKISIDTGVRRIEVTGLKRQYAGDTKIEDGVRTYVIDYKVERGKFMILEITGKT